MTAQIGADGLDFFGDPRPELLADVARVQPEPGGEWVNLQGRLGFRSTQRLRLSDLAGGVAVVTWPAELAPQARHLYGRGLGSALVAGAIERGWTVEPRPHLAYHTAPPGRRLYMRPSIAALDYAARWEDEDALRRVGNHTRDDVEDELWPWLKQMGFADDGDDAALRRFLDEFLRRRPAHMRPGLRFRRVWTSAEAAELGSALAETIRSEFDAMFAIAHEPMLSSAPKIPAEHLPSAGQAEASGPRSVVASEVSGMVFTGDRHQANGGLFNFGPSDDPANDSTYDGAGDADLLFRVYIPKTQLYAEQRREMLRLFRVWLTTVRGQDVRQQDFSTRDGDSVAFYVEPGQLRPALGEEYREFVTFVEYSAQSPASAIDRLTEIGIDESTGTELVTDYAKKYHRMELDLRHARQSRILSLKQTLEGKLLDKGVNHQGIAAIQSEQIRSLLDQVVPSATAVPSLPAIAAPNLPHPSAQVNVTFNAEQIIYTAIDNIQGTANFGPEAKQLLALISRHAGAQAGPLSTALHELEDPGIPAKERSTAKKNLTSFLAELTKRLPDVGADLLEAYLKRKLGLPGS